ncbi:MAG: protein-tyrosine phosphatase [Actinomycetota bacterium]
MARHVALEGTLNLRDLGGYASGLGGAIRHGCLFRSDELHALTDADLETVAALGVRVVFDLRNDQERGLKPNRLWPDVELHERETASHEPTNAGRTLADEIVSGWTGVPDDDEFAKVYIDLLTRLAPELRRIVTLAADADQRPLLFHCAAGKDRTGIAAAVLLGLLGVDEATILDDYELTTQFSTPKRLAEVAHLIEEHGANLDHIRQFISARRPVLAKMLDHLHATWGGFERYATEVLGVEADLTARLRAALLA